MKPIVESRLSNICVTYSCLELSEANRCFVGIAVKLCFRICH